MPDDNGKVIVRRGGDAWGGHTPGRQTTGTLISGPVTWVRDGDTIEIAGIAVRIANLDCDESGTATGNRATERMRLLTRQQDVTCQLSGLSTYDREVGACRLADGRDIGEIMMAGATCARWD